MNEPAVRITVRVPAGLLARLDAIAEARELTRAQLLLDAIGWTIAKETAWMQRCAATATHRQQRAADEAEALERTRTRHPERFDGS